MAVYTNATLNNITIPNKFDMDVLEARYAAGVLFPKVLNKSQLVKENGLRVSIEIEPTFVAGTVSVGGAFTPTNDAPSQVNLTLNTWIYVAAEIDRQAEAQSFWQPTERLGKAAGKAMAVRYDTDLFALHGSLTLTAVGNATTGETFDDAMARIAMLRVSDDNIPKDSLNWYLPPVAFYNGWFSKTELTAAYSTGQSKNVNMSDMRLPILGAPAHESTLVTTVGDVRKGLLLHKQAFAIAMQIENEMEQASRVGANNLSKVAVVHSLIGVAVPRTDHGVVINIKAA